MFTLATLALLLVARVHASIYITNPVQASTCTGGQSCPVQWVENGQAPLLSAIGVCDVGLYTGEYKLVQTLPSVDVSTTSSFTFTVDPAAGSDGQYYIVFTANGINYRAFSGSFALSGMTGTTPSGGSSTLASAPTTTPTGSSTSAGTTTGTSTDTTTASAPSGTTSATDTTTPTGTTSAVDTSSATSPTLSTPTVATTPTTTPTPTPLTTSTPTPTTMTTMTTTRTSTTTTTSASASPSSTNAAGRVGSSTSLVGLAVFVVGVLAF